MKRIEKLSHAAKVAALCLPPIGLSLIGLAALPGRKTGAAATAGNRPTSIRRRPRRGFPG